MEKIFPQKGSGTYPSVPDVVNALVHSEEPLTYLTISEVMTFFPQYYCELTEAFLSRHPIFNSFAYGKNWPYGDFLSYEALKMYESGTINIMHKKWLTIEMDCREDDDDVSLSLVKLVSLFAVLGTGIFCSLVFIVIELYFSNNGRGSQSSWLIKQSPMRPMNFDAMDEDDDYYQREDIGPLNKAFDDRLKKFMFKWGVSNRAAFVADFDELVRLKDADDNSLSIGNGNQTILLPTMTPALATTASTTSPSPFRRPLHFTYRQNETTNGHSLHLHS